MSGIFKPPFGAQLNLDHPLARGFVGCWLMNEGSGKNVHDYSGQWNEGTISGMNDPPIATSGWVPGPHGGALAFDGSNDYVDLNAKVIPIGAKTISFWIESTSVGDNIIIDDSVRTSTMHGMTIDMGLNVQGKIDFYSFKGTAGVFRFLVTSTNAVNDGKWHYIICTWDGTTNANTVQIYIDGSFNNQTTAIAIETEPSSYEVWVGAQTHLVGAPFNGLISSVSIYNRALSAEEIAYLYAFPYCMFDDAGWEAWMASNNIPKFMNYYRQMRAV